MSDDSISRKAVIEIIEQRINNRKSDNGSIWARNDEAIDILTEVQRIFVAYEVDKVVKRIDNLFPLQTTAGTFVSKEDVIRLVKGGGKNE